MPLLGSAAMLLSFDVTPESIPEHDDWHSHEHLPERLSIPGFLRGTRWVAVRGVPRYFVLYEVQALATLTSGAYLERLNKPSAWTSKMMLQYRGMRRGFCSLSGSVGFGIGHFARLIRFTPRADAPAPLRDWLLQSVLPALPAQPGLCCAHLLEGALTPAMTSEQRIRGADAGVDWALVLTGYDEDAVAGADPSMLSRAVLERQGAIDVLDAVYRVAHSLSRDELGA